MVPNRATRHIFISKLSATRNTANLVYLPLWRICLGKTGRKLNRLSTDLRLAYNVLNKQPLKTATETNILKETCTYVILDILTPPFWSQMGSKVFWKLHFHWNTNSSHYKISRDVILGAFTVRKSPIESIVLLQFFNSWVNSHKPSNVYCW